MWFHRFSPLAVGLFGLLARSWAWRLIDWLSANLLHSRCIPLQYGYTSTVQRRRRFHLRARSPAAASSDPAMWILVDAAACAANSKPFAALVSFSRCAHLVGLIVHNRLGPRDTAGQHKHVRLLYAS